jgi:GNAT superfamily N-acetyltransferase
MFQGKKTLLCFNIEWGNAAVRDNFNIRFAERKDTGLILQLIRELAEYEKLLHEVTTDEKMLEESLFDRKDAEVIIAEYNNVPIGYALFFHNFSTFLGKRGLYLEDLYIRPEYRGRGFGKKLFAFLANLALERNCGRMEWSVLDWNRPSIDFYKSLGARPMNEWTVYRLTGDALWNLADKLK